MGISRPATGAAGCTPGLRGAARPACSGGLAEPPITVACLFTTFPKVSEAFLQREVAALQERGIRLRLYSLWGGGGTFRGLRVHTLPRAWFFAALLWWIPYEAAHRPALLWELIMGAWRRRAPSALNFWENMLGAGFAACWVHRFRRERPDLVHAAWAGGPATAAWLLWRLTGVPFTTGAHAYELYEHGGDGWLREKAALARGVHTSTEMGRRTLLERGVPADRIAVIRRGLDVFPAMKALRAPRRPLRLVCVARLVPKKGLDRQIEIYAALRAAGLEFEARIVGGGGLRAVLRRAAAARGLDGQVVLTGPVPPAAVAAHLDWADVLLHTGVITPDGDRDGLPNVIPEAMAAGVLVVTSAVAATTEAVQSDVTGLVADVERPAEWVTALRRLAEDDALAERLRGGARRWAEEHYDARRNAAQLQAFFERAARGGPAPAAVDRSGGGGVRA